MPTLTISTQATELFPKNRLRKSFIIQNQDTTINAFLKREDDGGNTVSSTNHDFQLGAGATLALNNILDGIDKIQGRWVIIAASGTPRVAWFETEEIIR